MGRGHPPGPGPHPHQALCIPPMHPSSAASPGAQVPPRGPASSLGILQSQPRTPALSLPYPTPTWLLLTLQITPAVSKPLPCKWAALQRACVHECVCACTRRGRTVAGKAPCLCLAHCHHCLGGIYAAPTSGPLSWLPASTGPLVMGPGALGRGLDMLNWRVVRLYRGVLVNMRSPFFSMGGNQTRRVAEPPRTWSPRPQGPRGVEST